MESIKETQWEMVLVVSYKSCGLAWYTSVKKRKKERKKGKTLIYDCFKWNYSPYLRHFLIRVGNGCGRRRHKERKRKLFPQPHYHFSTDVTFYRRWQEAALFHTSAIINRASPFLSNSIDLPETSGLLSSAQAGAWCKALEISEIVKVIKR